MHGVVTVHGVGEHKRGDFLASVVNGLADALETSPDEDGAQPEVRRHMDVRSDPATATLEIASPQGEASVWRF